MPGSSRGTYCLMISCRKKAHITIGKLGKKRFLPGYYIYIGSALNNMDMRIKRHMDRKKKIFWHIDHLTSHKDFKPFRAFIINDTKRLECLKAAEIQESLPSVPGFGSSDCGCSSHLFYTGKEEDKLEQLRKLLSRAGLEQYYIDRDRKKDHE